MTPSQQPYNLHDRYSLHRLCLTAAAGGVLYALGHVGFGVWPLIFIFLVPLWCALDNSTTAHPGRAGLAGFIFGLAAFGSGFPWLLKLIEVFFEGNRLFGIALWIAYGAWFAFGFCVYALLVWRMRILGWPMVVAGPAPLLLLEWLQPQLFPSFAGAALIQTLPLAQVADLGGPLLLTALVALINVYCYRLWKRLRGADMALLRPTLATGLLIGAVVFYGLVRMHPSDTTTAALRVGVIQANLGGLDKRRLAIEGHRRHLQQTRELLGKTPLDLVIWPETAYGRAIRRPLPVDAQTIREDLPVPLLFGGTSVWEQDGQRHSANSAFLITAAGKIEETYDKNLLIPLAEFVPFSDVLGDVERIFPHTQSFRAGTTTPALHLGSTAIVTPICYEVIEPEFVRAMVRRARPQLLVTLASDTWFGDTQEPWIHLAFARLRAIEHRLWLIRSTTSGVSAVVDPSGRVIAQTGLFTRENLSADVYPGHVSTVYAQLGPWPAWLALMAVLVATMCRYAYPVTLSRDRQQGGAGLRE
ncbi:apolipoprotein N-acyltransferase [Exilibacterium tricleocarpae]|uniref:apolipoprotein N-acyltransferase n=1 Tax=Exilibacterium tricleocarpae TaxID=2591008 RepID=UPI0015D3DE12|nr:apolipoprotein N-acyltransferase [Exilibacterium tricleocarpae]